jgi:hypothetical protein
MSWHRDVLPVTSIQMSLACFEGLTNLKAIQLIVDVVLSPRAGP